MPYCGYISHVSDDILHHLTTHSHLYLPKPNSTRTTTTPRSSTLHKIDKPRSFNRRHCHLRLIFHRQLERSQDHAPSSLLHLRRLSHLLPRDPAQVHPHLHCDEFWIFVPCFVQVLVLYVDRECLFCIPRYHGIYCGRVPCVGCVLEYLCVDQVSRL